MRYGFTMSLTLGLWTGVLLAVVTPPAQTVAASASSQVKAAAPGGPGDATRGRQFFMKYGCYQCHGREAHGGAAGPRLGPSPQAYEEFEDYTRAPSGEMPPYTTKILSEADLRDIHAYVASRPKPGARAAILR